MLNSVKKKSVKHLTVHKVECGSVHKVECGSVHKVECGSVHIHPE